MSELSPLQKARYVYKPKLPKMLRNGISEICVKEGEVTQSVADQEKIKALFPNTYGKKEITFEKGVNTSLSKKQVVGVILSGGQAPGGHNVVCGLYDALKATNSDNILYGFKKGPSGLKMILLNLMTLLLINIVIQVDLILLVPGVLNWKQKNNLRLLRKYVRSMASLLLLLLGEMIRIQTRLF